MAKKKALMVGPYPPPYTGWSTAIKEECDQLRGYGIDCRVLNIGMNRKRKSDDYIDVQNGLDLILKLSWYSLRGYVFRLHVNGDSIKGIQIVIVAQLLNLLFFNYSSLTFHAGADQIYFPDRGNVFLKYLWYLLFNLSKVIICNCEEVQAEIARYKMNKEKVYAIPAFSVRRMSYTRIVLENDIEEFLHAHNPILFTYFAYRPEFTVDIFIDVLISIRKKYNKIGAVVVDDRSHSYSKIRSDFMKRIERDNLKNDIRLLGNVSHDKFLSVLEKSDIYVRTHLRDGVCSSVLEALALGVPVVAADNGYRPKSVVTFEGGSREDLECKLKSAFDNFDEIKKAVLADTVTVEDNVKILVDTLFENYW